MNTLQGQFQALQDNQKLLGLLLFSFITIVIWVSLSLVSSQTKTAISAESQALAKPLNPSINTDVLAEIEQKRAFQPEELSDFPIYIIYDESANTSIFDRTEQTLTTQPNTGNGEALNILNQPLTPAATGNATPAPTPVPTATPTSTPTPVPTLTP